MSTTQKPCPGPFTPCPWCRANLGDDSVSDDGSPFIWQVCEPCKLRWPAGYWGEVPAGRAPADLLDEYIAAGAPTTPELAGYSVVHPRRADR